ncbi:MULTISPECIES: hypothetical protein [unclassified Streptomyces]|uniref:hypothetical protein n=1 Tax=unclassified Streptomyces TaxID=2593676 RepID=UPI002E0D5864|nr:hypothetical protein OG452_18960 [Streptomyces sp. NBC_01197]WSS50070.1 hypothetical protein OG708_16295 [Streptomyces sp. NBC_01180]
MSEQQQSAHVFTAGPIWRDANVRSGPSLDSPVLQLLLPDDKVSHEAVGWAHGDEVIEGTIISDIWLLLAPGRWCSAVNFDQDTMAGIPREAGLDVK